MKMKNGLHSRSKKKNFKKKVCTMHKLLIYA